MEKLTKETFIEKVFDYEKNENWTFKGNKPAILDCFATWCNPCKVVSVTLEELSKKYEGKIDFYKVDIEEEAEISNTFNIRSVPSIFFIPANGDKPQLAIGAISKDKFEELIKKILNISI